MTRLQPLEISEKIKELSEIDIYKETRKTEYVEYRALLCFILRTKLSMRWLSISLFFESQGKSMNHANAIHLVKMYPIYKTTNPKLGEIENMFLFKSGMDYDEIDKVHYLTNKLMNTEKKYNILLEQLKNPLIKLMLDVPKEKQYEVEDRLNLLKKSWEWK